MQDIEDIRKKIDELDIKIMELLNKRAEQALKIKKTSAGQAPIRPERESDVVRKLVKANKGPVPDNALRQIFTQIIASFRDEMQLDKPVSVSYLGPAGTYSEEAAIKLFGNTIELRPEQTVLGVIRAVEGGSVNIAVLPIENSSEGPVIETHRLLQRTGTRIIAEVTLPVIHCLLSKSADLDEIKTVYAHPQALGQCRNWLATHLPKARQMPCASNSAAAELAAKKENTAAIAGKKAGQIYGLEVLQAGINDQPGNETRFIALGNLDTQPTGSDKTSVIIVLNDKPGALYEVLGILADAGISMTRLESRPYGKGQYAFYIDFAGHFKDAKIAEALDKVDKNTRVCHVLGSYPMEVSR
ncbi:MAG TPA: prephenate dehydratase [Candidatus Saccharimonadales bacterium]|nr:prephenate dehydratase [Candidatus Saccharimonadales bacterium]